MSNSLLPASIAFALLVRNKIEHLGLHEINAYLPDLIKYQAEGKLPKTLKSLEINFSFNF